MNIYPTSYPALLDAMVQSIRSQLPHLVSFSEGVVDQHIWERSSHAELVQMDEVVVDFFPFIRAFVGQTTMPSLLGSEFLDIYPGIFDDLHSFNSSLKYLLLGLPRWFPLQSLAKANIARHRLDNTIDSFHRALDTTAAGDAPELPWRDLSGVSQAMKARSAVWRKYNLPPALKGPLDLQLLWA